MNLAHVADRVLNQPLALHSRKAALIAHVLSDRIGLDRDGAEALFRAQPIAFAPSRSTSSAAIRGHTNGVQVIRCIGSMVNRGSQLDAESGLVSYDGIKRGVIAADNDPEINSVLLDLHSPGGEAVGAFECADIVHRVAQRKPVVAVINGMACSAGYAIAAAASKIVTTPSGISGSIGIVMIHSDYSRQLDAKGITPTLIVAGNHKADGNPYTPLSDTVHADLQHEVDQFYTLFVEGVAKHRPKLSISAIKATEARCYIGEEAVRVGLADEIGTYEDALASLVKLTAEITKKAAPLPMFSIGQSDVDRAGADGVRRGIAAAMAGRSIT